jgi:two-component system sensor histidine kinase BaeS
MRLLIWHKLFLAFLSATVVVIVVALALTRWSFNEGFLDYINTLEEQRIESIAADLAVIYKETGSWNELQLDRRRWQRVMEAYTRGARKRLARGAPIDPQVVTDSPTVFIQDAGLIAAPSPVDRLRRPGQLRLGVQPLPAPGPLGVRQPIDLLDKSLYTVIGNPGQPPGALIKAIEIDGEAIGYIRYMPVSALTELDEAAEQQFVAQQRTALYGTSLVALFIAATLAGLFGRRLVRPVSDLVAGTHSLAEGRLAERIPVSSQDELGQLAQDFNSMAESLETSRRSQQQWVADIAHELRTPLAILNGELQAAEDGVREWNSETRASLQAEVDRLKGLVNDLRDLSLSDAGGMGYEWSDIDLVEVVNDALDSFATRVGDSGLTLERDVPSGELRLHGDARRLQQLITNLLENSCRYTSTGGRIRVTCKAKGKNIHLTLEDTAPGVPDETLRSLFDRLYRVEGSRNRAHGGSGLGLAICKGIVKAHDGKIRAEHSPLGGLAIKVKLPRDSA